MANDNGIEVEGLVREFKKGPRAVDGIDLQVAPGEIYGFLGPNGAGKSTTVHMLTTLLPPTAGTARVAGFDIVEDGASVRDAIGVALQEAALDPFLTAREHMRLQAGMHGIEKAEAARRGDELIDRVGLREAADRKVGGYSGGMRRRLDLALALVHNPRLLFLDEPTTGLDVQSRTALWDEVQRLATSYGVTVFLTTQYLEEADALADRVGIIDTGKIVAEGTPDSLKAEIGRPTVEASPAEESDRGRMREALARFGTEAPAGPGGVAVRLDEGAGELADVVRALDRDSIEVANLEIHAPTLDDVFLVKTGHRLEGAGEDAAAADRRARGRPGLTGDAAAIRAPAAIGAKRTGMLSQIGYLARRSITRTVRQPLMIVPSLVFPLFLLAVNSSGLAAATSLPGFPTDSYLTFALGLTFMQGALFATLGAGQSIASDIQYGFFNRLQLTPLRGPALIGGQLAGVLIQGGVQAITYLIVALAFGADLEAGVAGALVLLALAMLVAVAFGSIGLAIGLRTGNGESVQGAFPLLFVVLFLSSGALPRDVIANQWFETVATLNPASYIIEAFRSLLISGWDGEALALGFGFALVILAFGMWAATAALRTRMERT